MEKIYDQFVEEDRAKVDALVDRVVSHITVNNNTDLDLLMAVLERLNDKKKSIKEDLKKKESERKAQLVQQQIERGRAYINTLSDGDMITFIYGSAPHVKQATLPIVKKGANSVQVEYTPDMLSPTSSTNKRNIRFNKIVVPEDFVS